MVTDYPHVKLTTKHGDIIVTVFDPSLRKGQREHETNALFRLDAETVINSVPVKVHAHYKKYPKRDQDGNETGGFWPQYQSYGITRINGGGDVPPGVRKTIDGYAQEALDKILSIPAFLSMARRASLTREAARLREEAAYLREKATNLDAEADAMETEAADITA